MNSATNRLRQVEPNASAQPDAQQRASPEPHFVVAGTRITFPLLGTMIPLLFGMLWLGAYRTAEKVRGVVR